MLSATMKILKDIGVNYKLPTFYVNINGIGF
jgi:hypothetical protein